MKPFEPLRRNVLKQRMVGIEGTLVAPEVHRHDLVDLIEGPRRVGERRGWGQGNRVWPKG